MTIAEWTAMVEKAYSDAGFRVKQHKGLPLVEPPESFEDKVRFLKFNPGFGTSKHIYTEGVLILPPGIENL